MARAASVRVQTSAATAVLRSDGFAPRYRSSSSNSNSNSNSIGHETSEHERV
jgi:hypothetical protein